MSEAANLVGRMNVYTCRLCRGYTVTIDRDEGTTPFLIGCRASGREGDCKGQAESAFYPQGPKPPHIPEPAWEWVTFSGDIEKLPPMQREHARLGGLFLQKIGSAEKLPEGYERDKHGSIRRL